MNATMIGTWCMVWSLWQQKLNAPKQRRPLAAARILLCAVLGVMVFGLCLTLNLHAAQLDPTGMGCHGDCWYQRPAWQPAAVLPHAPVLPLPPELCARFVPPDTDVLTEHDQHGRTLPSRSPPTTQ